MIKIITCSEAETRALGEGFAKDLKAAAVLTLTGPLGSGKTVFAAGLARGLGLRRRTKSPSFAIMHAYRLPRAGRSKSFFHLDLYRLRTRRDLRELGLPELLRQPKTLVAIEWPALARKILPQNTIKIKFAHGKHPKHRIISFSA